MTCPPCDSSSGCTPTRVTVRESCTCGARYWWDCRCTVVSAYEVETHDTVPSAVQLAWIREQHPGATLIY